MARIGLHGGITTTGVARKVPSKTGSHHFFVHVETVDKEEAGSARIGGAVAFDFNVAVFHQRFEIDDGLWAEVLTDFGGIDATESHADAITIFCQCPARVSIVAARDSHDLSFGLAAGRRSGFGRQSMAGKNDWRNKQWQKEVGKRVFHGTVPNKGDWGCPIAAEIFWPRRDLSQNRTPSVSFWADFCLFFLWDTLI